MNPDRFSDDIIGHIESVANGELANAITYQNGYVTEERAKAFSYFDGEPYGNEVPGQSQVVTRDVMETVLWCMPSLMRIFMGGDDVVKFDPRQEEDEQAADQATEWANHVFRQQNEGFQILYDMFFDALLQKNGVAKVWYDDRKVSEEAKYRGLSAEGVALHQSQGWIIKDITKRVDETTLPGGLQGKQALIDAQAQGFQPAYIFDVTFERDRDKSQVCIESVPPEEILVSRNSRGISEDTGGIFHRRRMMISDLIAEGYDPDDVWSLASDDDTVSDTPEALARYEDQGFEGNAYPTDDSARYVWVTDCYVLVDTDDDGRAELRKVTLGGASDGNGQILIHPEHGAAPRVEVIPFAGVTSIPIPHRYYGLSLADIVMDLQLIHSTILRQSLQSLYLANNPRMFAQGNVNYADLLTSRAGGVVRGDVGSNVTPLVSPHVGQASAPMIEYIDRKRMARTGVNKFGVGLDANKLQNESATAAMQQSEASNERIELIARIFAETGVKRLFWLIMHCGSMYSTKPQMIRLRDKFVEVNPREWRDRFDMSARVGLGTGNKDRQVQSLTMLGQLLMTLKQDPAMASMVTPSKVYNFVEDVVESSGLKRVERYLEDPAEIKPPEPQPNPEMMKAQAELQMKQQESQARLQQSQQEAQMRAQSDQQKAQMEAEVARYKADLDAQQQRENAQLRAAVDREVATNKLALERDKLNMEHEYRMREMAAETQLEREKMAAGSRDGQGNINLSD